jgi:hypothetical protein
VGRVAGGCDIFCTRAAFDAVGGFDEQLLAMEKIVLGRALHRRGRVVFVREAVAHAVDGARTPDGELGRWLDQSYLGGDNAVREGARRDGVGALCKRCTMR